MSTSNIAIEGGEGLGQKRVCQFTDQEIENIRKKDPDARIMKVVYDDVERVLTMEKVKNTLTAIRGLYEGYRKETPEATMTTPSETSFARRARPPRACGRRDPPETVSGRDVAGHVRGPVPP